VKALAEPGGHFRSEVRHQQGSRQGAGKQNPRKAGESIFAANRAPAVAGFHGVSLGILMG
jgi:hypothetical protein